MLRQQAGGELQVFSAPTEWSRPAEGRDGLGATSSVEGGLSAFVGVGPTVCHPHAGVGVSVSFRADDEDVAFTDINGDGLPDFVGSNGVWLNSLPDRSSGNAFWPESVHKDVEHPGDPIDTVTFVDGLDRVIQTKKDLEKDPGTGAAPTVGMSVVDAPVR
ncbi:hypothetical protein WMF45_37955 [Sorangium sp. So ce448]|uniref:hypothetical protein n=1 Tax=Sorangium sp. So ce448 TaxID=3133314 RepID=UPI003F60BE2B